MGWHGPGWTVGMAVLSAVIMLTGCVPILLWEGSSPSFIWVMVTVCLLVVAVGFAGIILARGQPRWGDRHTTLRSQLWDAIQLTKRTLDGAGMEFDETRDGRLDWEFHVRSSDFRVGLRCEGESVTVFAGPVKDWNAREVQRFMDALDGQLGR